jgi:uncharacterized protein YfkK (UPF0435 family)
MKQIRVNVKTRVNNAAIRRETRNGREVIIVPSATLPDNVVMNGIMYPADEIEKSYQTLNRTPAPLGHPVVNGKFVSARDPEAINGHWVGAWNENVRRENGRVLIDKVIDVDVANSLPRGKQVIDAINAGEPIHTSTGLIMQREPVQNDEYGFIARNMQFDHDAILLNESGAATPEQGVGMMVNGEQVEVVNVSIPEDELEWMGQIVIDNLEREDRKNRWAEVKNRVVAAIRDALNPITVAANEDETMDQKQFDELKSQVESLVANRDEAVSAAVQAAVEPLTKQIEQLSAANKAAEEARKGELVSRIVNVGLLDEETAKTLDINALTKLAEKCKPGLAAPIAGHFTGNADEDEFAGYDLNAAIDGGK